MSLVDFYNELENYDAEMTKEAEELEKVAAEEEAAGRIMARGFLDELNKLAGDNMGFKPQVVKQTDPMKQKKTQAPGQTVPPPRPSSVVNPGAGAGMQRTQQQFKKNLYEK